MFRFLRFLVLVPVILLNLLSNAQQKQLPIGWDHRSIRDSSQFWKKTRPATRPTLNSTKFISHNAVTDITSFAYTYPVEDCFTYTYNMTIGAANEETVIKETHTALSGITYTTGFIFSGGSRKGFVQEIAMNGDIAWTKVFSITGRNLDFNSIRSSSTGTLLVIGTSQLPNGTDARPYIAELTVAGNVIWSRSLNAPGFNGGYISALSGSGYGFVAYNATSIVTGALNTAGNLQWLKQLNVLDNGYPIGMSNNGWDSWYIAYTGTVSGRRAGSVIRVDANGNIPWKTLYGGTAASEYILHDAEFTNNHVVLSGIYSTNNGPYALFKSGIYTTAQTEFIQTFNIPGVVFTTGAHSDLNPYIGVISFSPSAGYPEVFAIKTIIETNPNDKIHWTKKFPVPANYSLTNVTKTFDGGFLIAGNVTGGATINTHLIKTDSTGLLSGCPGISFQVQNTFTYVPQNYSTSTPAASSPAFALANAGTTVADVSPPVNTQCKSLTCPPRPPDDECLKSFARRFRSGTTCDLAYDLIVDDGNKLTVMGIQRDNPYDATREMGFFAEFDNNGKLLSRRKSKVGPYGGFSNALRLRDGNLLVLSGGVIAKLNPSFQLIWNKSLPITTPYSTLYGMVEGSDGSIYVNYVKGVHICLDELNMLKLNANGTFNWQKKYSFPGQCPTGYVGSLTQDEDYLYAVNYLGPVMGLMKIRKTNGSVVWTKGYTNPGASQTLIGRDISIIGDNLIFQGTADHGNHVKDILMVVDKNGNTVAKKEIDTERPSFKMVIAKNSDIVLTSGGYYTGQTFIRLDSNFNVKNSKVVNIPGLMSQAFKEGDDGSFYRVVGNIYDDVYEVDFSLIKFAADGSMGECDADTLPFTISTPQIDEINLQATATDVPMTFTSYTLEEESYSLQENFRFCRQESHCDQLELDAPSRICDTLPVVIKTIRNADCAAYVEYTVSDASVQIISKSDTGIVLKISQSGTVSVKARMFTGCEWLEDEVLMDANVVNRWLNLGNDTILCNEDPIILNAGTGYNEYLWNDGSTGNEISTQVPGKYFVDAIDGCGKKFSDTIQILPPSTNAFYVGQDQEVCSNEDVKLSAPVGFIDYRWIAADASANASTREITLRAANMQYFASALRRPGCFVYDTIAVSVTQAPLLDLGANRNFCEGDSTVLDAGNNFVSYLWNNSAGSSSIIVKQSGRYHVAATSADGCVVKDTITLNAWENPVVQLQDKNVLCEGEQILLSAGNGFQTYMWHDGSESSTFTASGVGKYYVTVTDGNQCAGSDTIEINSIASAPANFLVADTGICSYAEAILGIDGHSYQSYQWSNGEQSNTIKVKDAGVYILQVRDMNNCVGRDTITVFQKACMEGFFVSNAFTPDNDGNNDTFKPVLLGKVSDFRFTVFDRWGNIVFTTTSIDNAWNGWVNGKRADGGTFVWQCGYTFAGGEPQFRKGFVLLVR